MDRRRVVITGIGIVSPVGGDRESTWSAIRQGISGVRRLVLPAPQCAIQCLGAPAAAEAQPELASRAAVAASACSNVQWRRPVSQPASNFTRLDVGVGQEAVGESGKLGSLVLRAAREAIIDAGLETTCVEAAQLDRFGCSIASSKGNLDAFGQAWMQQQSGGSVDPRLWLDFFPGTLAAVLAGRFGVAGPVTSPVAACATGAHSMVRGAQWIQDGTCDVVLAGCADASLDALIVGTYQRMGVLAGDTFTSPEQAVRPFAKDRQGFVIGEGAAVFVLEAADHARQRGHDSYVELAGWRLGSDAYSCTNLREGADSLARCIQLALEHAETPADRVGHVNCHGTATAANDRWEAAALERVFGPSKKQLRCTANKSMVGHLLGASGGVELALTALALRDQFVPPTLNLETPDPECDFDFSAHHGREHRFDVALKTSLGFGGHLAALILRRLH